MNRVVCKQSDLIKKGRVFDVYAEKVILPNGVNLDMEVVRHPGAAAVVAMMDDRRILLIKQYRYAVDGLIWEIPAGTLDEGEDSRCCAERELTEETGYTARKFEKLTEITPLPAYSDERIHIYLATGLERACQNLDADEMLTVHPIGLNRAMQMIAQGKIQDAKTIAGLHLAAARVT